MKYFTSALFVLLLWASTLQGQITYNASDFLEPGDTVRISKAGISPIFNGITTAGEDLEWDFSYLTASEQELKTFYPNTESSYKLSWCLLNIYVLSCTEQFNELTNMLEKSNQSVNVGNYNFQNVEYHYKKSDAGFSQTLFGFSPGIGILNVPVPVEYSYYDTLIHFPLYFGRQDSSYGQLDIDLNATGVPLKRKTATIRKSEVDAWGSISTPYGTFENTIRLRTDITTIDSLDVDSVLIPITTYSVEYLWFDTDYPYPIFKASGNVVLGVPIINSVEYIDSLRCFDPNASFALWPPAAILDSATHTATVSTYNWSSSADTYQWYIEGEEVSTEEQPTLEFVCPENYNIRLIASNSCNATYKDTLNLMVAVLEPASGFPVDTLSYDKCPSDSLLLYGSYYSEPGYYSYYTTSHLGCDSLVMLNVQDKAINLEINNNSGTLVANQEGATYQWVDCSTFENIEGATEASFTPETNGNYAVWIGYNDCMELSECISYVTSNIQNSTDNLGISVYPNPLKGSKIQVDSPFKIKAIRIYTTKGQMLKTIAVNNSSCSFDFTANSGVYILNIEDTAGNIHRVKIIR